MIDVFNSLRHSFIRFNGRTVALNHRLLPEELCGWCGVSVLVSIFILKLCFLLSVKSFVIIITFVKLKNVS